MSTSKQHSRQPKDATRPGVRHVWTRPGVLAAAVVVVLIYGSLIPFDFAWGAAVERNGGVFATLVDAYGSPAWVSADQGRSSLGVSFAMSDLLLNIALYLPLGMTMRMAIRSWRRSWLIEVFGTAMVAFALSWSLESLQSLMPSRVASINDVLANTGGALAAACLARSAWELFKRATFWAYCRLGGLAITLRRLGDRPGVVMGIALINSIVIGLWYLGELYKSGVGDQTALALPFERAFELPYDLGVLMLGEALLAYAGIGCLLLLLTYTGTRRIAMRWVVLGVVLLALMAELSRTIPHNAVPDITGPLLALSAGAIMTVTIYTFSLAVKRSNRRHRDVDYQGPDRRRRPHDYA